MSRSGAADAAAGRSGDGGRSYTRFGVRVRERERRSDRVGVGRVLGPCVRRDVECGEHERALQRRVEVVEVRDARAAREVRARDARDELQPVGAAVAARDAHRRPVQ